jgi:hypothetical protein
VAAVKNRKIRGNQRGAAFEKELETLLTAASDPAQEMGCFCEHGFRAHDNSSPGCEEFSALPMEGLALIEKRDQGSCVEQELTGHAFA